MNDKEKVTLVLPRYLMTQVRELAPARGQSEFIAEAISFYLSARQRRALRERLVAGYQAYTAEDTLIADEWRSADDESWLDQVGPFDGEGIDDGPDDSAR